MNIKKQITALFALALFTSIQGCNKDSDAENAIEDASDAVSDTATDAADVVEDAAKDVTE